MCVTVKSHLLWYFIEHSEIIMSPLKRNMKKAMPLNLFIGLALANRILMVLCCCDVDADHFILNHRNIQYCSDAVLHMCVPDSQV